MAEFKRGRIVTVSVFGGRHMRRRVWGDSGEGLLLCSEDQYLQALATGQEPLYAGFPKASLVNVEDAKAQPAVPDSRQAKLRE